MAEFCVREGDITQVASDLLLLKHAQGFYGADLLVATRLIDGNCCKVEDIQPSTGKSVLVNPNGVIAPKRVMVVGTEPLAEFKYSEMYRFARRALNDIRDLGLVIETITTTVHGVNCGLDGARALTHLVSGFRDELSEFKFTTIAKITFLTLDGRESSQLKAKLEALSSSD
jgi:hypothetical protein